MALIASKPASGRCADRLINLTDGTVAIAITLLALPLVEVVKPEHGEDVWAVVGQHGNELTAFIFTFVVMGILWSAHSRILSGLHSYSVPLFWINTAWLAALVLLPWLSALYADAEDGNRSQAGLLYWGALALIALLGSGMAAHLGRHPELSNQEDAGAEQAHAMLRGPVLAAYFLAIGLVSMVSVEVATWMPLGIIPLGVWSLRHARKTEQTGE